jgi:hypothetical protein
MFHLQSMFTIHITRSLYNMITFNHQFDNILLFHGSENITANRTVKSYHTLFWEKPIQNLKENIHKEICYFI